MSMRVMGTMGLLIIGTIMLRKLTSTAPRDIGKVAAEELRKVLMYAAPPTFLATQSQYDECDILRWMDDGGPALAND
jgi:hypothetical protein